MSGDSTWSRHAFVRELPDSERYDVQGWNSLFTYGGIGLVLVAGAVLSATPEFFDFYNIRAGGARTWVGIGVGLFGLILLLLQGRIVKQIMVRRVMRRSGRLFDPSTESCMLVEIEALRTHAKLKFKTEDMGLICVRNGWLDMELSTHRARFPLHEVRVVPVVHVHGACVQLHYESEAPAWRIAATIVPLQDYDPRDLVPGIGSRRIAAWIQVGQRRKCRRCEYDLQATVGERCPECGAACFPTSAVSKFDMTDSKHRASID